MIQQAVYIIQTVQQIQDEVQGADDQAVDQAGDHIQQRPQRFKQNRHYSTPRSRWIISKKPALSNSLQP